MRASARWRKRSSPPAAARCPARRSRSSASPSSPIPTTSAKLMQGVEMCKNPYEAAKDADVLVILTEWDAYRALDLDRLKRDLKQPLVVDLRNIYRPEEMAGKGFRYFSLG